MCRSNLWWDFTVVLFQVLFWLIPFNKALWFFREKARFHGLPLCCVPNFHRVNIMSEWSNIEYTTEWLFFLNEECHVWFLPDTLKNATRLERINTRSLMFNLHPYWTELINFGSITFWKFFNRLFSVFIFWSHCHPSLCLRNNLHHFHIRSIGLFLCDVIVVFIIHDFEKVRETFLVTT